MGGGWLGKGFIIGLRVPACGNYLRFFEGGVSAEKLTGVERRKHGYVFSPWNPASRISCSLVVIKNIQNQKHVQVKVKVRGEHFGSTRSRPLENLVFVFRFLDLLLLFSNFDRQGF